MNNIGLLIVSGLLGFISCLVGALIHLHNLKRLLYSVSAQINSAESDLIKDISQISKWEFEQTFSGRELLATLGDFNLAQESLGSEQQSKITRHEKAFLDNEIMWYEEERMRLAMELHETVLQQLAVLTMKLSDSELTPQVSNALHDMTRNTQQIIRSLRPPMLEYGLQTALGELRHELLVQTKEDVALNFDIVGDSRYASDVEKHLFRIVEEATRNAIAHASAKNIQLTGSLMPNKVELVVEDDGIGLSIETSNEINSLLENKYYGLAALHERAALIGADLNIQSQSGHGTRLEVKWQAN